MKNHQHPRRGEAPSSPVYEKIKAWTHWMVADPYKMAVISIVGSPYESAKVRALPPSVRKALRDIVPDEHKRQTLEDWMNRESKKQKFCDTGVCQREGMEVYIWFPAFPNLPTLIHELDHAAHFILTHAGVEETGEKNEAHAYLLSDLAEHFIKRFNEDIKKEKLSWL